MDGYNPYLNRVCFMDTLCETIDLTLAESPCLYRFVVVFITSLRYDMHTEVKKSMI